MHAHSPCQIHALPAGIAEKEIRKAYPSKLFVEPTTRCNFRCSMCVKQSSEKALEELLKQFKALSDEEKLAFMKEGMPSMADIFAKDPQKMMSEMMPFCMNMMKSKGMDMDRMRSMMKNMMGS